MTLTLTLCAFNKQYVCAEGGGDDIGLVTANRDTAGAWETWTVHQVTATQIALETVNHRFLCAEGGGGGEVHANRLTIGPWETFTRVTVAPGQIALRTHDGHFLCAEDGGGREVNATRTVAGAWETFSTTAAQSGTAQMLGRLHVDGRALRYPDGSRYTWRGITAMALLEMVAHGREAEAVAWMQAARALGFTLVRVLAMNHGWLDLPPADGRAALPRLLELAAACDLYVLVVALAGTKDRNSDFLEEQVHAIGAICGNHDNALAETANEPFHGSQNVSLYSPVTMAKLRAMVPAHVPVTYGAPEKDEPLDSATKHEGFYTDGRYMSGGNFVVIHLDRRPDPWDRLRRFTEVAKVSSATGKFTVDDEGKGYAETATTASGNSREVRPEVAYAHGVLARGFNLGATFHCEDGLLCKPLGPVQTACAAEFIAGTRIVSDDVSFVFANAKSAQSAVKDASLIGPSNPNAAMLRAFSFFALGHNLLALVGLRHDADPQVQFQHGWHKTGMLANRTGFAVWQIDQ